MRHSLLAACLALALAGCGGGGGTSDPQGALSETASNLGNIRSGELDLSLLVDPREEGGEFGFELSGPFQLSDDGELDLALIEYTQIADDERETVTVTVTEDKAFVTVDGQAYELPEDRSARLRLLGPGGSGSGDGESSGTGLEELRIEDWIRNPESSDGDEIGGDETDKVEADLDVLQALKDLSSLVDSLSEVDVGGSDAKLLQESTRNSRLEVHTGKEDRLLRRLVITAEFDPELPEELAELARAAGANLRFELELANPNDPVEVEAPADPRPFSELN